MRRSLFVASAALLISFSLVTPLSGQLEPPSTGGMIALSRQLRMLGHYRRVLMIGAHPDDEDTELLTVLVRQLGAEAAYLSLNRGEGGQNLIGPELGEALGLLRTEELLAARRLDGARQFFTRAYDFGYSKTLEETWSHWPRDTILKDVVRVVRSFRPQIIVSIFSGQPRDGHGQHQAAGWAAREAFEVVGDPSRFAELLREERLAPWTPLKLYRSTRFDSASTTLTLDGGRLDPVTGKSYHQIAMAGRSLHRSQDMGRLQDIGPSAVRLALLVDRTGRGGGDLFAGVDTALGALPALAGLSDSARASASQRLARYTRLVDEARRDPAQGRSRLESARALLDSLPVGPELEDQRRHLASAITIARGIVYDAVADDDKLVGGQVATVRLSAWNAGAVPAEVALGLDAGSEKARRLGAAPGQVVSQEVKVRIPEDRPPTAPEYLREPLRGALYRGGPWLGRDETSEPISELVAEARLGEGHADVGRRFDVVRRINDQSYGEVRRPLIVAPRVELRLEPRMELWSTLSRAPHRLTVTLTHRARDTTTGEVRLELPQGWPAVAPRAFRLTREDEREMLTFEVRPPARFSRDSLEIRAIARDRHGGRYESGLVTVDYSHIRPRSYPIPAVAVVRTAPLELPRLARVGYVRGAADQVPEALRRVGVPVVLLDRGTLEGGDLGRFDAIVVGPRAYETDSALVENNGRLLGYARRGGLVIVQYQQQQFFTGGYAPYPLTVGGPPLGRGQAGTGSVGSARPREGSVSHDRVTNESAPVRVVAPRHSAVLAPNRLTAADWEGWIQERGLYFARSWDPAYQPILETHDPDEAPLKGGLLVARVGRGTWVYTGLSFFRQLPAAVPGAFRLFANLLALR